MAETSYEKPDIKRIDDCVFISYPKQISIETIIYVIQAVEKIENGLEMKINRLHDMRFMDKANINHYDMSKISQRRKMNIDKITGTKAAFVVSKEVHYGLSRMYQQLMKDVDHQVDVFRDIEKAKKWLNFVG